MLDGVEPQVDEPAAHAGIDGVPRADPRGVPRADPRADPCGALRGAAAAEEDAPTRGWPEREARGGNGRSASATPGGVDLWWWLGALALGCLAAILILATALHTEFPLFSEASAARGRDCATIRSARHALEPALELQLDALAAHPVEAGSGIRHAVDAFRASTADIATPAVSGALSPVQGDLERLADAVDGAAMVDDPVHAVQSARDAMADLQDSWGGALARVCA
ncbi:MULTISPECIES: hypothetical protein [unclassified Leifsonia]|uniref:hypothetical protein n=1 Tax=unclassified Leifsonia TaxID=2663824 RepID=UPI0008A7BE64|nr:MULTISPECIES: hypothetical protein [unclassified Leifsonia]SEI12747.1 hypothetical protein SAMN04515694_11851 [Leifsonia sp. CL154]SFL96658.1 hypothetical protein SAMN04515692_11936 [Leifsonia sp. CL147]